MDTGMILQMVLASIGGAVLYTLSGIAPGTDDTYVVTPLSILLAFIDLSPNLILDFFIVAIVAKKLTDSIPVAVAGIPGGVMAAHMVDNGIVSKKHGLPDVSITKMASGSIIGT